MKYRLYILIVSIFLLSSCKDKDDKEPSKTFISTKSLINDQIKHIDTSLYSIVKIVRVDTFPPDTSFILRENFAKEAEEFLDIPDLSNKKIAKRFREEAARYDETTNRVIIEYLPIDSTREEYKSQELVVTPNVATSDKVSSILVKRIVNNRDGFMQKNLLWLMDRNFQITTITQAPGQPEKISTVRVVWNEEKSWNEEQKLIEEQMRDEKIK